MGELIEIDTGFNPSQEQKDKHDDLQRMMKQARIDLKVIHEMRFYRATDIYFSWQKFHNGMRNRWIVYKNIDN